MSRVSRAEALARFPLSYELTVRRGDEAIYRTMGRGILGDVLRDGYHLAAALGGDALAYTRQAQRVPAAPDGKTYEWFVGEQIERGVTTTMRVARDRHGATALDESIR